MRKIAHRHGLRLFVAGMLCLIFLLNALSIRNKTLTADEPKHFGYGLRVLFSLTGRIDDSKMPFSALNALAVLPEVRPGESFLNLDFRLLQRARLVTSLFSLLLAYLVYRWARELYGTPAGMLALTMYAFAPNILAHSRLITTDLYAALMVTSSLYAFWKYLNLGGRPRLLASAGILGLAQLAKFSCAYLYPIFLLIVLCREAPSLLRAFRAHDWPGLRKRAASFCVHAAVYALISIAVINCGYLFNRTGTPLGAYKFKSDFFQGIQAKLSFLESVPLPLPAPYIEGLDWVKYLERKGGTVGCIYLLGQRHFPSERGFFSYYLVAFLFKVPLAVQFILAAALVARARWIRVGEFYRNEVFLFVPILFFSIYFSFFFRAQIGIRFLLVIFPLLFVFAGSLVKNWQGWSGRRKGLVFALVAAQVLSALSYHPHYISYFNELVWNRSKLWKILADSNLEWGQNRNYLREYLEAHPDAIVNPKQPVSGHIIVRANSLAGVFDGDRYKWLRDHFEPAGNIAYSYIIFDVPPNALPKPNQ